MQACMKRLCLGLFYPSHPQKQAPLGKIQREFLSRFSSTRRWLPIRSQRSRNARGICTERKNEAGNTMKSITP
jgi:hypothetical protein